MSEPFQDIWWICEKETEGRMESPIKRKAKDGWEDSLVKKLSFYLCHDADTEERGAAYNEVGPCEFDCGRGRLNCSQKWEPWFKRAPHSAGLDSSHIASLQSIECGCVPDSWSQEISSERYYGAPKSPNKKRRKKMKRKINKTKIEPSKQPQTKGFASLDLASEDTLNIQEKAANEDIIPGASSVKSVSFAESALQEEHSYQIRAREINSPRERHKLYTVKTTLNQLKSVATIPRRRPQLTTRKKVGGFLGFEEPWPGAKPKLRGRDLALVHDEEDQQHEAEIARRRYHNKLNENNAASSTNYFTNATSIFS